MGKIVAQTQVVADPGTYLGEIIDAQTNVRTFKEEEGEKTVVDITIMPDEPENVMPLTLSFTPVLNRLSALSKLLESLGCHPEDGEAFDPFSLVGTRVRFKVVHTDKGFAQYVKESVVPAE